MTTRLILVVISGLHELRYIRDVGLDGLKYQEEADQLEIVLTFLEGAQDHHRYRKSGMPKDRGHRIARSVRGMSKGRKTIFEPQSW